MLFHSKECPPSAMLLAATGLLCGIAGAILWLNPAWMERPEIRRLAGLLLYQGFLLGPVMGVGTFLFPRLLGGEFGGNLTCLRMTVCAASLTASFPLEIWGGSAAGQILRTAAFLFAISSVSWKRGTGASSPGTLANALRFLCLPLAVVGLIAPVFSPMQHVALDHLLFVSGFGLLCLIAASRVLFGHSGSLATFSKASWVARAIVLAITFAALARASANFLPEIMISQYQYAAWSWSAGAVLWTAWHTRRFFKKDPCDD